MTKGHTSDATLPQRTRSEVQVQENVRDDIYQNVQFNETSEKDGGQFSPHILLRETRAYPHEKGECDK